MTTTVITRTIAKSYIGQAVTVSLPDGGSETGNLVTWGLKQVTIALPNGEKLAISSTAVREVALAPVAKPARKTAPKAPVAVVSVTEATSAKPEPKAAKAAAVKAPVTKPATPKAAPVAKAVPVVAEPVAPKAPKAKMSLQDRPRANAACKKWAAEQGHTFSATGHVRKASIDAFLAAHPDVTVSVDGKIIMPGA